LRPNLLTALQMDMFSPVQETNGCVDGVCPVPWVIKEEAPILQPDLVNNPSHYSETGVVECIEAIESQLTIEEYAGYLRGNCVKYLWRWKNKGGVQDLKKCKWYLERLIAMNELE